MLPNILLLLFTGIKTVEHWNNIWFIWLEIPNFARTFCRRSFLKKNLGGSKPRWSQNDINGYLRKVMNLRIWIKLTINHNSKEEKNDLLKSNYELGYQYRSLFDFQVECTIQLSHMPPPNTRGAYFESLVSG